MMETPFPSETHCFINSELPASIIRRDEFSFLEGLQMILLVVEPLRE